MRAELTVGDFNTAAGRLSIRAALEPQLACICGAHNSHGVSDIKIDENGVACCNCCGRGGEIQRFLPREN